MAKVLEDALSLIHGAAGASGEWDPAEGGLEVGKLTHLGKGWGDPAAHPPLDCPVPNPPTRTSRLQRLASKLAEMEDVLRSLSTLPGNNTALPPLLEACRTTLALPQHTIGVTFLLCVTRSLVSSHRWPPSVSQPWLADPSTSTSLHHHPQARAGLEPRRAGRRVPEPDARSVPGAVRGVATALRLRAGARREQEVYVGSLMGVDGVAADATHITHNPNPTVAQLARRYTSLLSNGHSAALLPAANNATANNAAAAPASPASADGDNAAAAGAAAAAGGAIGGPAGPPALPPLPAPSQVVRGLMSLERAALRLAPRPHCLTPLHVDFLQARWIGGIDRTILPFGS